MNISNFSRHASAVCATVALLAGCNGATNVTPTQSAEFAPNVTRGVITVAHGVTELHRGKNSEHLKSSSGSGGRSGCLEIVNASGKAGGAYPGTFTGFAGFNVCPLVAPAFREASRLRQVRIRLPARSLERAKVAVVEGAVAIKAI